MASQLIRVCVRFTESETNTFLWSMVWRVSSPPSLIHVLDPPLPSEPPGGRISGFPCPWASCWLADGVIQPVAESGIGTPALSLRHRGRLTPPRKVPHCQDLLKGPLSRPPPRPLSPPRLRLVMALMFVTQGTIL